MSHAIFDAAELSARESYRLMTSMVVPRPIAWVGTRSAAGVGNLAPYSYFQAVCSDPATVVLGMGSRPDGRPKDSLRNILDTREFTISHVDQDLVEGMNASSAAWEPEFDEAVELGIEMAPLEGVAAPRVAKARAGMACRLTQVIPLGMRAEGVPSSSLVIARVSAFWVEESLIQRDAKGRIFALDAEALDSVGRMGGLSYTRTRERFELERPGKPKQAQ